MFVRQMNNDSFPSRSFYSSDPGEFVKKLDENAFFLRQERATEKFSFKWKAKKKNE
jgi:hypothetical protein